MPSTSLVTPRRWFCLLAAGLVVAMFAASPQPLSADQPKFTVPLVIGGITYQGDGVLADDGTIRITVVIVYRQQVPGPTPPPTPPDPPTPTPNKIACIYLVHESGDGTPEFTAVRSADGWKKEAEKLGIRWLIVDKDTAKGKIPEVVRLAVAKGLPAIVLLDSQKLPTAEPCPKTPDAMLARVKQAGVKP